MSEDRIREIVTQWFAGRNAIDKADAVRLCAFVADTALGEAKRVISEAIGHEAVR